MGSRWNERQQRVWIRRVASGAEVHPVQRIGHWPGSGVTGRGGSSSRRMRRLGVVVGSRRRTGGRCAGGRRAGPACAGRASWPSAAQGRRGSSVRSPAVWRGTAPRGGGIDGAEDRYLIAVGSHCAACPGTDQLVGMVNARSSACHRGMQTPNISPVVNAAARIVRQMLTWPPLRYSPPSTLNLYPPGPLAASHR